MLNFLTSWYTDLLQSKISANLRLLLLSPHHHYKSAPLKCLFSNVYVKHTKLPAEIQGGCPGAQRCSSSHRLYSVLDPSVARADQGRIKSKQEQILLYDTSRLLVTTHEIQIQPPQDFGSCLHSLLSQWVYAHQKKPSPFQALMPEPRTAQKATNDGTRHWVTTWAHPKSE